MNASNRSTTRNGLMPVPVNRGEQLLDSFLDVFQGHKRTFDRMKDEAKNVSSNGDTSIKRNLLELEEIGETIYAKINHCKKLFRVYVDTMASTEDTIRKDLCAVTSSVPIGEESDSPPSSSSESLPPHLRDEELVLQTPLKSFTGVLGIQASTPKITATLAARSLETLILPSTSRGASGSASSPNQVLASPFLSKNQSPSQIILKNGGAKYEPSRGMLIHVTYDHPPRKELECPYCRTTFMSKATLLSHLETKHVSFSDMYQKVLELYEMNVNHGSRRATECTICLKHIPRNVLIPHMATEHIFEVNNFIWIHNFKCTDNSWREFFMKLQGTNVDDEKAKSKSAKKKSNLKPTLKGFEEKKEPYDKIRVRGGSVKRGSSIFLETDASDDTRPASRSHKRKASGQKARLSGQNVASARQRTASEGENSQNIEGHNSENGGAAKKRKRGRPRTPMKDATLTTPKKEVPNTPRKRGRKPGPRSKKEDAIHELSVGIEVELIDLDAIPKELDEEKKRPGPLSKVKSKEKIAFTCDRCSKKYGKDIDLALHRFKFCRYRKPLPTKFNSSTLCDKSTSPRERMEEEDGERGEEEDPQLEEEMDYEIEEEREEEEPDLNDLDNYDQLVEEAFTSSLEVRCPVLENVDIESFSSRSHPFHE